MIARAVRFRSSPDGPVLEGRLSTCENPRGVAVLCHPYPPLGGSMSNALIPALQRALHSHGWASLRFNFRGVGRSEGVFDGGRGEIDDARAALAFAVAESGSHDAAIVGWSFGAVVGLVAATRDPFVGRAVAIATPVSGTASIELPAIPGPEAFENLRTLLISGSRDPVSLPADVRDLAGRLGGVARIVEGAGHFFEDRFDEVAGLVTDFLGG